jgi:3',5'-cyclic AMP phosphodiesterase CpdA
MDLTIGFVTDIHVGPEALFDGKLRKLTAHAPALLEAFVARMNREVKPDLIVNLGDDIEDESLAADRARYAQVIGILGKADAPVIHVAGNHDTVHLGTRDLIEAWGNDPWAGAVYGAIDRGGYHLVVLHTLETKYVSVSIDDAQLAWLERDLATTTLPTLVFMHHTASDQVLTGNRWFERAPHLCLVRERKRLRAILEHSKKVLAVFNGHLHWNHLDVHGGIPYVTVQSLVENLDEDAPGRPAAAHAVLRVSRTRLLVEVEGAERSKYQFERPTAVSR